MGLDFLESAPYVCVATEVVHRPPAAIFDAVANDPAGWGAWFPGFSKKGRYLSDAPFGVGTVREVSMAGVRYTATILAWEPPERWAFQVTRSAAPIAFALAEQYRITPHGHHAVVEWTFAMDPRPVLRWATPLMNPLLPRLFRRAMTNLSIKLSPAPAT